MKKIRIPDGLVRAIERGRVPVKAVVAVDWFPRLTEEQILENAAALAAGQIQVHDDPNLIELVVLL